MSQAIILFGSPGSGKGLVSNVLSVLGYGHIGTGDLMREIAAKAESGDPEASCIYSNMSQGALVEDSMALGIIQWKLNNEKMFGEKLTLDTLRSPNQVIEFSRLAREHGINDFITVYLRADRSVCSDRMYHRATKESRPDDNKIEKRLDLYQKYSGPTLEALRVYTTILEVDAELDQMRVVEQVLNKLNSVSPGRDEPNLFDEVQWSFSTQSRANLEQAKLAQESFLEIV